jgi:hypothetical protein
MGAAFVGVRDDGDADTDTPAPQEWRTLRNPEIEGPLVSTELGAHRRQEVLIPKSGHAK